MMGPHDAQTMKKLQHIRKLSESIQRGIKRRDGNIQTIPITEEDITVDWVRMIINQYKIKFRHQHRHSCHKLWTHQHRVEKEKAWEVARVMMNRE